MPPASIPLRFRCLLLAAAALACTGAAAQADAGYPNRPLRVVVPYPPGGNTDDMTREVMKELSARLGQTIVVDNKPGANSIIGTESVAKSAPDGYTLGVVIGAYAINQSLYKKLPYTPQSLVPVSLMTRTALVLVAAPQMPGAFKGFVALGQKGQPPLSYATSGKGGANHILGERFAVATGLRGAFDVAYKGSNEARGDLLTGRVQFSFDAIPTMEPHIAKGAVHALAVTSHQRSPQLPAVPTIGELGHPELVTYAWAGLLAPAGTPPAIVDKLSREIAQVMKNPEFQQRLARKGSEGIGGTPAEFSAFLREEVDTAGQIVRRLGLSAD
ncbi:Bug family tripartite tricarboxylate transporter substrate binding protein [Hydrogenophaga borbori]|uniref:Bug family tripartite tricarboxylate transporter substrate binding protein n=1 Tax=Hydrogenophaga borbori TaxID=2294117 RepID=UPI00301C59D3